MTPKNLDRLARTLFVALQSMDDGYPAFLNLLSQPGNVIQALPKDSIYGPVAHYAHTLPLEQVHSFIRTVVISPSLWSNHAWLHLMGIWASIRQSVRLKVSALKAVTPSRFIFGADIASPLVAWAMAVVEGLSSARSTLEQVHASIAVLSGLSSGLVDVRPDIGPLKTGSKIDSGLTTLCSEAIAFHSAVDRSAWGNEFNAATSIRERMTRPIVVLAKCTNIPNSCAVTLCLLAQSLPSMQSGLLLSLDLEACHLSERGEQY